MFEILEHFTVNQNDLVDLILYVPVNYFSVMSGRETKMKFWYLSQRQQAKGQALSLYLSTQSNQSLCYSHRAEPGFISFEDMLDQDQLASDEAI